MGALSIHGHGTGVNPGGTDYRRDRVDLCRCGVMDRESAQPISIQEAKNRLRNSVEEALPSAYVRRHPYTIMGVALATGFMFGKSHSTRKLFTRTILAALWAVNESAWQARRMSRRANRTNRS